MRLACHRTESTLMAIPHPRHHYEGTVSLGLAKFKWGCVSCFWGGGREEVEFPILFFFCPYVLGTLSPPTVEDLSKSCSVFPPGNLTAGCLMTWHTATQLSLAPRPLFFQVAPARVNPIQTLRSDDKYVPGLFKQTNKQTYSLVPSYTNQDCPHGCQHKSWR